MSPNCWRFNRMFSSLRIRIEHTIGRLKAWFSFLRHMPNKGNLQANQLREIYKFVASTVVFHNMLQAEDP